MPITDAMPELDRTLAFVPVENPAPKVLTREQVDGYNRLGYVTPTQM